MSLIEDRVQPIDEDAPRYPVAFSTRASSYIALVLLNLLLNIVTLTIYRFWGKTAIRRRLWAETEFAGDTFEYTGSGWELCRGFLIALVIFFLPVVLFLYAGQAFLPPEVFLGLVFPLYMFAVLLLVGAALYFQRRYQLSRTLWRGIRFGMDGSAWSFALFMLGQQLLIVFTLGWWAPTARQRIARRLWRNARYGDKHFTFHEGGGLAGETYGAFAIGWVVAVVGYLGFAAAVVVTMMAMSGGNFDPGAFDGEDPTKILPLLAVIYGYLFLYALIVALAFLAYEAAAMRRTAELLSFGATRFRVNATLGSLFGLTISNIVLVVFSLGLLYKVAEIRRWRYVIGRLEAVGDLELTGVGQSGDRGPKSGEGLADGFDFGGI